MILTPHPGSLDTINRLRERLAEELSGYSDLEVELLWKHFSDSQYAASFLGDPHPEMFSEFLRWMQETVDPESR